MSNYSVYQVLHDSNYFEIFTILLQVGMERVTATKALQSRLQQWEMLKAPHDLLAMINTLDRILQQGLRQEKQRVDKELALVEMLVSSKRPTSTHIMSFHHLSLKIINQWFPTFSVRQSLSGEHADLAELYSQFFLTAGMAHRHQQVQAIRKNNLYEKVPFLSLLMKWLHEFARAQFSRYFSQLYEQISTLKANYNNLKQPEVLMSPRIAKVTAEKRPLVVRPNSCLLKQRSASSYTQPRRNSQVMRQPSTRDLRDFIRPVADVLDIELSHFETTFIQQKKLLMKQEPSPLFNLLLQRNNLIRNTRDSYYVQAHSNATRPLQTQCHYYTPQNKRPDRPRDASFFNH